MENNPFFNKFYSTISEDFEVYRPGTTDEEKGTIIHKAMRLFSSSRLSPIKKINIDEDIESPIEKFTSTMENRLFMFRSLQTNMTAPHNPPETYKVFNETSFDLYENYSKTLDYLQGTFYIKDVISCRDEINNFKKGRVLCWSNTNILLDHVLQTNYQKLDIDLLTFGSPILVPNYKTISNCINLYHEDDWMLGFVSALHKIDFANIPKDKLIQCEFENNQTSKFVVISRNKFLEGYTMPHRYYYAFF